MLETHQQETNSAFESLVADLNAAALKVIPLGIDRAALNFDENTKRMQAFVSRLTVAERTGNVEPKLNPFCYYVRGLSNVTTYQYELAIDDLETAARKAREDIASTRLDHYPSDKRENLPLLLANLLTSCTYFQGVCYKNLGQYPSARGKFVEALDRNQGHWESRNYLLQCMFFDDSIPFATVEGEFRNASERLKGDLQSVNQERRETLRRAGYILKLNQGDLYYKSPLPQEFRSAYLRYVNPEKAAQCYWEAFDYVKNEMAHFCLAQALEQVGSSLSRSTTYQKEYAEAFNGLKTRVAGDFDKLYSVTLYYMLAICASKLSEHRSTSEVFLAQARHGLKELPTQVTCFSPISRIRLTRLQILNEMEQFEKAFL